MIFTDAWPLIASIDLECPSRAAISEVISPPRTKIVALYPFSIPGCYSSLVLDFGWTTFSGFPLPIFSVFSMILLAFSFTALDERDSSLTLLQWLDCLLDGPSTPTQSPPLEARFYVLPRARSKSECEHHTGGDQ